MRGQQGFVGAAARTGPGPRGSERSPEVGAGECGPAGGAAVLAPGKQPSEAKSFHIFLQEKQNI